MNEITIFVSKQRELVDEALFKKREKLQLY